MLLIVISLAVPASQLCGVSFPVFYNEVLDSLVRGFHEKISPENLILEVNSSKFAYNVTVQELNSLVVKVGPWRPSGMADRRSRRCGIRDS